MGADKGADAASSPTSTTSTKALQVATTTAVSTATALPVPPVCIPVSQACEALWSCQDVDQAIYCIQALHAGIILEQRLDTYDPSEAFLAVQGAALRFRDTSTAATATATDDTTATTTINSTTADNTASGIHAQILQQESKEEHEKRRQQLATFQTIREKSLFATAAMAHTCVGPAWWHQVYQRRMLLESRSMGGTDTASDDISSIQTSSSSDANQHQQRQHQYQQRHQRQHPQEKQQQQQQQQQQQHERHHSIPSHPEQVTVNHHQRSYSTMAPAAPLPFEEVNCKYPPIPEVLPAAMLRFATTTVDMDMDPTLSQSRRTDCCRSTARAQIILVLAITCGPELEEQSGKPEWIIPGVQAVVEKMVLSWLRLTMTSADTDAPACDDEEEHASKFTLQVTRACTDIISSGWRPHTEICEEVVDFLLGVARGGIGARSITDDRDTSPLARQKDLARASGAAEAISALVLIGSHELVPPQSLTLVVETLCRLYACEEYWASDSFPVDALFSLDEDDDDDMEDIEEAKAQNELFKTQRELCLADIADFLWILLARDSSAEATMEALLSILDQSSLASTNCKLPDCEASWNAEATVVCLESGMAIRIVSGALWGKAPDAVTIPSLRVYWNHVIGSISRILSSIFSDVGRPQGKETGRRKRSLSILTIEMVHAVSRAIDMEIRGDGGLSHVEWTSVVECMQEGITPWLSNKPGYGDDPLGVDVCYSTVQSFFVSFCDFLEKYIQFESIPFAEYADQKILSLMLLRDVSPYLETDTATIVGSAAVCCWAKFGIFPHRMEGWSQTASDILGEIFSTNNQGNCIYTPRVRLEALKALTFEESELQANESSKSDGDTPSRSLTLGGSSQHMREQHLSFIDSSIIPALRTIIWSPLREKEAVPDTSLLGVCQEEAYDVKANEEIEGCRIATLLIRGASLASVGSLLDLELFTVKLIGRLFRGVTGDRQHRSLFVEMLRSVALNEKEENDVSCPRQLSHAFPVRIAAVVELERCLAAPFSTLPHAHESVPRLIEAFCSILDLSSEMYSQEHLSSQQYYQASTLAASALDPLTRLRVAIDSHVAFRIRKRSAAKNIDDILLAFFSAANQPNSSNRSTVAETCGATFLVVRRASTNKEASNKTLVSFEHIATSLIGFLGALRMDCDEVSSIASQFCTCVKVTCFDALRSMALACIPVEFSESMIAKVFFPDKSLGQVDSNEILARSRALGQIAQIMAVKACERQATQASQRDLDHRSKYDDFKCAVALVLRLVGSRTEAELVSGCDVLCSLLSTIIHFDRNANYCFMEQVCDAIESRITIELERVRNIPIQKLTWDCLFSSVTLLKVIHDLLLVDTDAIWQLPEQMVSSSFRLCNEVIARSSEPTESFYSHLAIRCVVALVDRMNPEHIECYWADSNSKVFSKVTAEVLEKRSYALQEKDDGIRPDHYPVSVSKLEMLAMETANIDRFEVEDEDVARCKPSAAWLCGENVLLTCRIGASKSRYRGWLEVTIRTLSGRTRLLIRLPGRVSLKNPEFPGSLWTTEAKGSNAESDPKFETTMKSDVIADRARAALSRFDALVLSSDKERLETDGRHNMVDELPDGSYHAVQGDLHNESSPKDVAVTDWLHSVVNDDMKVTMAIRDRIDALLSASGIDTGNVAHAPTRLEGGRKLERAISILDRISVLNTHKIAFLYDRPEDSDIDMDEETRVLTTTNCSPAFHNFSGRIGKLIPTRHLKFFSAGLDVSEYASDGKYAMTWIDEDARKSLAATNMIVFHVVSLMPDGMTTRKRHVGNDNVLIFYSDKGSNEIVDFDLAGRDLTRSVLRGEFGLVTIYVTCPCPNFLRVSLRVRNGLPQDLHDSLTQLLFGNHILPEQDAPAYVRNLAIRADLACRASVDAINPPSNCLERYRLLHEMQRYINKG